MVRVVRTKMGALVDLRQVLPGRGAYVHRQAACVESAVRRGGLERTLKCSVPATLLQELREGLE
jgi:uncharacterized protein